MSKEAAPQLIDISTPEGQALARKALKSLKPAEALRSIADHVREELGGGFCRSAAITMEDKEKRLVRMSFSSEAPVERWFGTEVLSHERGAPNLEWLNSGRAPALWMHNGREQIGVVVSADHDVKAKRCSSVIRLAKDAEGDKYLARVEDGIICNVSFAYRIDEWTRTESSDDEGMPTYTATKWRGVEISLVSTPADETVGVGRSLQRSFSVPDTKTIPTTPVPDPQKRTTMTPEEIAAENKRQADLARAAERKRINGLNALRKKYEATAAVTDEEFARFSDDEKMGETEFRSFLLDKNATPERSATVIVTDVKERSSEDPLPLLHALRGLVFGSIDKRFLDTDKSLRAASPACFTAPEQNQRSLVVNSDNVRATRYFPSTLGGPGNRAAQSAQQFSTGGALVGTTFAPDVIEYLRPVPVMQKAGAIIMSGITGGPGTIRFPKQTGDIYGQWAASQVASTAQVLPFGVLDLTPKRLIAQVQIDKQLLLQESFDVEAFIRNSVNMQFALAYDLAGLIGNGNGMPLGILNTPNIQAGSVTFNGPSASSGTLAPQYSNFLLFRQLVLAANAGGLGKRTFISSPQSIINFAGVPKATPAATQTVNDKWLLEFGQGGKEYSVLGEEALETTYLNTLPSAYSTAGFTLPVPDVVIYGPFSQYMFIEWAGVEWIYDPYTMAAKDLIVLTARLYVDGGCRQPTAFVTSSNAGSVVYV